MGDASPNPWEVSLNFAVFRPNREKTMDDTDSTNQIKLLDSTNATIQHDHVYTDSSPGLMMKTLIDNVVNLMGAKIKRLEEEVENLKGQIRTFTDAAAKNDEIMKKKKKKEETCTFCGRASLADCPIRPPVCGLDCLNALIKINLPSSSRRSNNLMAVNSAPNGVVNGKVSHQKGPLGTINGSEMNGSASHDSSGSSNSSLFMTATEDFDDDPLALELIKILEG